MTTFAKKIKDMSKLGVIAVIEQDKDDWEILETVIKEINLPNEVMWFRKAEDFLDFLCTTQKSVFIIICDIDLPGRDGLQLKHDIDGTPELRRKSIPFIFYTTVMSEKDIDEAYLQLSIQGFFQKSGDYAQIKDDISMILNYWSKCKHPNSDSITEYTY